MIKKILVSIGVLFSFFLMFLFGLEKINIIAYSDSGNTLGSYPVKLDIDNYNMDNIIDIENRNQTINGVNYNIIDNKFNITGQRTSDNNFISVLVNDLVVNGNYTLYRSTSWRGNINLRNLSNQNVCSLGWNTQYRTCSINDTIHSITFDVTGISMNTDIEISGFLTLTEGDLPLTDYSPFFKFGYNVHYSVILKNNSSSSISSNISILLNGNLVKSDNCVVPSNSTGTICNNIDDPVYLPFQIDNNGNISFSYNLQLRVEPIGNLSFSEHDSGLAFIPIFNAYYKGVETNNLYFRDSYTFNNLFLSGFNVNVNSTILSNVAFATTNYDDSFVISSNENYNIYSNKLIKTGLYNHINFIDYLDIGGRELYYFVIPVAVPNVNVSNNRIYNVNISSLSVRVIGDSGTTSPLPGDNNILEKYNSCSAWYDIPCQLGNAITYVIYEAPIISPVLTFIVSFITMFSSLVSFVDIFRSFGIVFGCFIIYMFIELLHKYSK